jgi:hypothetical protein
MSDVETANPEQLATWDGDEGDHRSELEDLELPFTLGANPDDASEFAAGAGPVRGLLQGLDAFAQQDTLERLRATIEAHATSEGVLIGSRAWLVSAVR